MAFKFTKHVWIGLSVMAAAVVAVVTVIMSAPAPSKKVEDRKPSVGGKNRAAPAVRRPTLPEAYAAPTTHDPALSSLVDRRAKNRIPADMTSRIPEIKHAEDLPVVVSLLADPQEGDTVRNEAANLLRRSGYPGLTSELIKVLDDPRNGARFRSFAIQHLWESVRDVDSEQKKDVVVAMQRALDDSETPVRREALLALVRMGDAKGRETAVKWLTDENGAGMRDAAIRCVQKLGLREHIPTIRKYLRDENEVVRIAAIVTLSQWGDEQSRPAIEEAAKSESFRLSRCAKMALKRLDRAAEQPEASAPVDKAPVVPPKAGKAKRDF